MLKLFYAITRPTLMVALILLTIPCLAQQQPITEGIFNAAPKRNNMVRLGKISVGEYELGKALIARQDDPDPTPPPAPRPPR